MTIYPAIDLKGGKCVRLMQGDMGKATVYGDDPAAMARSFAEKGAEWLHVVDLDGAFAGKSVNSAAISSIVESVGIPVQLGGGIRSMAQLQQVFELGVARVILGTAALQDEVFVKQALASYANRIAVGIDARDGRVAIKGWAEETEVSALAFANRVSALGVRTIVYTDILGDGMLAGYDFSAAKLLINQAGADIILAGGMTDIADVQTARRINAAGVVIGKAVYAGTIILEDAIAAGGNPC
jgi:phosphoribosylformimino-5-aminoimidazole carboxamide ribotide isomerase